MEWSSSSTDVSARKTNLSAGLSGSSAASSSAIVGGENVVVVEETMFQTLAGVIGNVLEWYGESVIVW